MSAFARGAQDVRKSSKIPRILVPLAQRWRKRARPEPYRFPAKVLWRWIWIKFTQNYWGLKRLSPKSLVAIIVQTKTSSSSSGSRETSVAFPLGSIASKLTWMTDLSVSGCSYLVGFWYIRCSFTAKLCYWRHALLFDMVACHLKSEFLPKEKHLVKVLLGGKTLIRQSDCGLHFTAKFAQEWFKWIHNVTISESGVAFTT